MYVAAWEFKGVGERAGAPQGAAGVRGSASDAAELQIGGLGLRWLRWLKAQADSRRAPAATAAMSRVSLRSNNETEPENLAAGGAERRRAGSSTTSADHVSPDMSFLEMLDVVNEGLIKKGEGRDRVRLGLPRRHLRHVQPRRQRRPARARPRHDGLPAAHAALQGRRHDHHRAVARQGLPGRQGSGRRSQRVRSHHRRRRLRVGQLRRRAGRQRAFRSRRTSSRPPWTPPPASAAAPASRPARTPRRTSS